jgi:hypothetical protein
MHDRHARLSCQTNRRSKDTRSAAAVRRRCCGPNNRSLEFCGIRPAHRETGALGLSLPVKAQSDPQRARPICKLCSIQKAPWRLLRICGCSRRAARCWSAGNSNSEFAAQIGRTGPTDTEHVTGSITGWLAGCHQPSARLTASLHAESCRERRRPEAAAAGAACLPALCVPLALGQIWRTLTVPVPSTRITARGAPHALPTPLECGVGCCYWR